MTDATFAYDDGDIDTNRSTAGPHLNDLVAERYSRRQTLRGGLTAASAALFGGALLSACGNDDDDDTGAPGTQPLTVSPSAPTAGQTVTLTGVPSNGVTGTFAQTSGPTVILTPGANGSATFIAPGVAAPTALAFTYTAPAGPNAINGTATVTVAPAVLGFAAVAKSLADVVAVPTGYTVTVLYRLGDPLANGVAAYANDGSDTNFAQRAGDHHDGMSFFGLTATGNTPDPSNSARGVLVMNHENINQSYLHTGGATNNPVVFSSTNTTLIDNPAGPRPLPEVLKEIECHGVSAVEVTRGATAWAYAPTSTLNRRVTPFTATTFSGPVRGNPLLFTAFSPTGIAGRGTINNCANGYMPWNTYLTCEENWAGYFRRTAGDNTRRTAALGAKSVTAFTRYGLNTVTLPGIGADQLRVGNYGWATAVGDDRIAKFDASVNAATAANGTGDFRNEPNQYGWVVEIDPFDPAAAPRKRTALGRMNHEGCWPGRTVVGVRPAFYMGDDAQNEYIYKFVSTATWAAADATATNRLAIGDKYLDAGTLYVARFNADGTGVWMPLVFGTGPLTAANATYAFADQADVLTHARLAGDALGATRMDRPEWTAVNPATGEMYCTLTNNSSRTVANTDTANPRAYTDPRTTGGQTNGNANGHIVRLRETGDTTEATTFAWDVYAYGAGSDLNATNINLSSLDATNDFSSPDGLWFGRASNATGQGKPLLWIQTDDGAFTDQTNCMMLAGIPGTTGDGTTRTITNTIGGTTGTQTARIGAAPGGTLRRFLVGPKECEITGIDSTPDGRTVFVNIQHPGENGGPSNITSNWPQSQATGTGAGRPRSATIAITRTDGGIVGL